MTTIWAHRGASGYEVDNTIESFDLALSMGADGLESDVRRSRDGELILYHDAQIPWQGNPVRPERLLLEEIRAIDLGNGRRVPTLAEALERYAGRATRADEPVRWSLDVIPATLAGPTASLAARLGVAAQVEITLNDAAPRFRRAARGAREAAEDVVLMATAGLHPSLRLVRRILGSPYERHWRLLAKYGFRGVNLQACYATPDRLQEIKTHGLMAYVWDCHDELRIRSALDAGADALYTNYPDSAYRLRRAGNMRI
jgi:glycerophosphoryl diester phosphodiesterase